MSKPTSSSSRFLSILLIVFIVLKLTDLIDWSWWWVLAPLWIPLTVAIPLVVILGYIKYQEDKKQDEFLNKLKKHRPKGKFEQKMDEMMSHKGH